MSNTKITSAVIKDANILTAAIADAAVTSAKIADDVALAGNPTAGTQTAGNNSTRLATTAYTDAAVTALVDSSPSTLNTLNELAAALGDDPNFATTTATSIGLKAPLASPTFTGTVTANAGVVVDNFTLDGTTLALSSGDMLVDVAGNITLDADDAGEIRLKDGGTQYGALKIDSSRFKIQSIILDADMLFAGNDGGSEITALSLDMSAAGAATFSSSVLGTIINAGVSSSVGIGTATADANVAELGSGYLNLGRDDTASSAQISFSKNGLLHSSIVTDNNDFRIKGNISNLGISFDGVDGDSNITALRLDMANAGAATFASSVTVGGAVSVTDSTFSLYSSGAGATIGNIGNTANDLNIYSTTSGHNGLRFHVNGILPTDNGGTIIDNDADLGDPSYRFKNLYLSGSSYIPDVRSTGTQYLTHTTDVRFRNSTGTERLKITSYGGTHANNGHLGTSYTTSTTGNNAYWTLSTFNDNASVTSGKVSVYTSNVEWQPNLLKVTAASVDNDLSDVGSAVWYVRVNGYHGAGNSISIVDSWTSGSMSMSVTATDINEHHMRINITVTGSGNRTVGSCETLSYSGVFETARTG
jgi:hypothetical protein